MSGGPCCLKIEAAGDAVDIENFACKVEPGLGLALHRLEIEVFQMDAAAGDEFVLVGALAGDLKFSCGELVNEFLGLFLGEVGPCLAFGDFGRLAEAGPEADGDALNEGALRDGSGAMIFALGVEDGFDLLGEQVASPIDLEVEAVIAVGKAASIPGGKPKNPWAAESPVGDEDGACHGFFESAGGGKRDGNALEVCEARVVDVKGEEGGDGRGEFMFCIANSLACFCAAQTAGSDEDVGSL